MDERHDVVIIGGGPGGEAVVRRLAGHVLVGSRVLQAGNIVIAVGTETDIPPIPGLPEAGYWTNRDLYTMRDVPADAVVLGGGPVGVESAEVLRRYGSDVTVVETSDRLLSDEDPAIGEIICRRLTEEGVIVRLGVETRRVTQEGDRRR